MSDCCKLEKEQAMLRMVIVGIVFMYILVVGIKGDISTNSFEAAVKYGVANILISAGLGVLVWRGC